MNSVGKYKGWEFEIKMMTTVWDMISSPFVWCLKRPFLLSFLFPFSTSFYKEVGGVLLKVLVQKVFVFSMFWSMETHKKLSNWFSIPTQVFPFLFGSKKGWMKDECDLSFLADEASCSPQNFNAK